MDPAVIADLLFLEAWEVGPMSSIAAAMRAAQIWRANPELAAQIRKEVQQMRAAASSHTAALSAASLRFPSISEDNDDRPDPKADHLEVHRNSALPGATQNPPGIGPSFESLHVPPCPQCERRCWWRVDVVSEWICWMCEPPALHNVEQRHA